MCWGSTLGKGPTRQETTHSQPAVSHSTLGTGHTYLAALHTCLALLFPIHPQTTHTILVPLLRRFIHDWVYSGVFRDVYGEFMIQVNHEYLSFRGKYPRLLGCACQVLDPMTRTEYIVCISKWTWSPGSQHPSVLT